MKNYIIKILKYYFICQIIYLSFNNNLYSQGKNLLNINSPATKSLIRLSDFGLIPDFPKEHLPISRYDAYSFFLQVINDTTVNSSLKDEAIYFSKELFKDSNLKDVSTVINTDQTKSIFKSFSSDDFLSIYAYADTSNKNYVSFNPILDGEFRKELGYDPKTIIFQIGAVLSGTFYNTIGFSTKITNGTIFGDTTLAKKDPHLSHSGKFGVLQFGRDIDFSSSHLRVNWKNIFAEIAHEKISLGGGNESSLLLSSQLPSEYDYIRLGGNFGLFSFTHIHASILSDEAVKTAGANVNITSKYIAAHLASVKLFCNLKLSIGESVIYSGRNLELGYFNPFLFIKSQEHYLRDRDNTNMYASISYIPQKGMFLETEYLLDDLRFRKIYDQFWGNKFAFKLTFKTTSLIHKTIDLGLSYTRLEPYIFTHFNQENTYTHDGTILSAGGLEPNSHSLKIYFSYHISPKFTFNLVSDITRHGANEYKFDPIKNIDTLFRNVGGSVLTQHIGLRDSDTVSFLDGNLEKITKFNFDLGYEFSRNIYIKLNLILNNINSNSSDVSNNQLWLGLRIGEL